MEDRRSYWAYLFGRLKPGVSAEQGEAALTAVYRPIVVDVEAPLQEEMSEATMARFKAKAIAVQPGTAARARCTAKRARRSSCCSRSPPWSC